MRILVASDSFKDGCTSIEACNAIAKGIKSANPNIEIEICPISDGGEGTAEVLHYHLGGERIKVDASNPLFKRVQAQYLITKDGTAFIEMAQASGLELLASRERNPMNTSTFGTGEMIKDAMNRGCKEIVIAVGGSATNDLGLGMASALGTQFVDSSGNSVAPIGYNLSNVSKIDSMNIDSRVSKTKFTVITDVNNVLFGPNGAAHVFARQKGANDQQIDHLDSGLNHLADIIKRDLNKDIANMPGSGAAGGLGGACMAFLDAEVESGIDQISKLIDLESKIQSADIIITGEGHLDNQTRDGKLISGICGMARQCDNKVIVFCGKTSLSANKAEQMGIDEIIEISNPQSVAELEMALAMTKYNLEQKAKEWAISNL